MLSQPIAMHPWDREDAEHLRNATEKPAVRIRLAADGEVEAMQRAGGLESISIQALRGFALSPAGPENGAIMVLSTMSNATMLKMVALSDDKPDSYYVTEALDNGFFAIVQTDYASLLKRLLDPVEDLLQLISRGDEDTTCRICGKDFVTGDILRALVCQTHGRHPAHHGDCADRAKRMGIKLGPVGIFFDPLDLDDPEKKRKYDEALRAAEQLRDSLDEEAAK